jgi:hypothetical protein
MARVLHPRQEKEHRMSVKFGNSIRRALRVERTVPQETVHFHSGHDGRAYPCDVAHCESPHLAVQDIGHTYR